MKLAACIENTYLYNEQPDIPARIRAAKASGLDTVEFHLWMDRDVDAIERTLREERMKLSCIVVNPRCGIADASKQAFFVESMSGSLAMAKRLGARGVVAAGGPLVPGASAAEQHAAMVAGLKAVAPVAQKAGVQVWLENLNSRVDHKGFYMDTAKEGLDIIAEVGSPAVRLLYDAYHSVVMGESPREILKRVALIGHVQVADTNGRHEPGSGIIDWQDFMAALRASGYAGDVGLEYRPTGDTAASVAQTRRVLGL